MFSTVERGHLPMYSDNCVIHADNISKLYRKFERPEDRLKEWLFRGKRRYSSDFWALSGVSMDIDRGETVGIVGRNGSGKSTLLKLICGTVRPTTGTISVKGRISALLELGAGFNNEFTGRENIHLNASLLGLTPDEIAERMDRILAFAEIGSYIDQPVKYYSSGMFARLAFSVAVHVDPQILIIDEILAVGDMAFQRK
ncbi:MAG: ABC transporter ATP-binding protein, partial [Agrobacterium tumefaciens]